MGLLRLKDGTGWWFERLRFFPAVKWERDPHIPVTSPENSSLQLSNDVHGIQAKDLIRFASWYGKSCCRWRHSLLAQVLSASQNRWVCVTGPNAKMDQDYDGTTMSWFAFENRLSATMSNENKPGSRYSDATSIFQETASITFWSFCDLRSNGCVVQDGEAAQRLRVMPAHQQRLVMKLGSLSFPKLWGIPNSWLVSNAKSTLKNKWMIWGVPGWIGNHHVHSKG